MEIGTRVGSAEPGVREPVGDNRYESICTRNGDRKWRLRMKIVYGDQGQRKERRSGDR